MKHEKRNAVTKHEKATPDFSGMAQNEKKHPHLAVYRISQRDIPSL